jgi:hypothetical protein
MLTRELLVSKENSQSVWSSFQGSSVLVTGATGLVGLNILRALSAIKESLRLEVRLVGVSKSGSPLRGFSPPKMKNQSSSSVATCLMRPPSALCLTQIL